MKYSILTILLGLTFGTYLYGQTPSPMTGSNSDSTIQKETLNAELLRLILDNDVVQEAIFKISGRKMYPMQLISPSGYSAGLNPQGYIVDTGHSGYTSMAGSVLEITTVVQNEASRECKMSMVYNSNLKITVKAYRDEHGDQWHLQNIFIINDKF